MNVKKLDGALKNIIIERAELESDEETYDSFEFFPKTASYFKIEIEDSNMVIQNDTLGGLLIV